ncbi:meiosis recombination protein SPO11-like, putative [Bodo saltans]|uniref:Meiosis recombination protein SPO11-like, putative n=1 Tax=Bodo saltans TaxID=75058 RepID=A0A0S4JRU9_BODSA|nr:meiosis recombination protein SPO11-like, putative [Bodo saltans]|eukprot:CUG92114.1 meiosis recombination protein SPO11-like, putative [Bodo saltans]
MASDSSQFYPSAQRLTNALESLTLSLIGNGEDIAPVESNGGSSGGSLRKKRKLSLQQMQQQVILINDCYSRAVAAAAGDHNARELSVVPPAKTLTLARCTERDLYYMHSSTFPTQAHVTGSIRAICDALNNNNNNNASAATTWSHGKPPPVVGCESSVVWTRSALGIDATAKSILAGSNTVIRLQRSAQVTSSTLSGEDNIQLQRFGPSGLAIGTALVDAVVGISITERPPPPPLTLPLLHSSSIASVALLVVEKESTLRHLLTVDGLWEKAQHWTFLCTKGFPCAASKSFLRVFHQHHPTVPIFILCDGDVFGVHIAWCLCRTSADDRSWYEQAVRKCVRKRSHDTEGADSSAASNSNMSFPSSVEWSRFVSFIGSVRFIGLTASQVAQLAQPGELTAMPLNEVSRATKLRAEFHIIQKLIREHSSVVSQGESRSTAAALNTLQQFVEAVDGLIAFKRKAELLCASWHPLGILGAILSIT